MDRLDLSPPPSLARALLQHASEATLLLSAGGRIQGWNDAAAEFFGRLEADVLGLPWQESLVFTDPKPFQEALERLLLGQEVSALLSVTQSCTGKADAPCHLLVTRVNDGQSLSGFLVTARERTGEAALRAGLDARLRQQAGLAWLGQRALVEGDLRVLLQEAAELVQTTLEVDFAQVLELLPEGTQFAHCAGLGWQMTGAGHILVPAGTESLPGFTLRQHQPVAVENFALEHRFSAPQLWQEHGVVGSLTTSIGGESNNIPFGVMGAQCTVPRIFSQDDSNFLQTVASLLAAAIRQANVARERSARLHAEEKLRDIQTAGHQRTVLLEAANRVALDIISSRMGVEALRHIAEAARVLAGARYAALGVAHVDRPGLEQFITSGLTPEEEASIGKLPKGAGILGLLLEQDKPLRFNNLADHPASVGFPPNHPPMSSFLGVPIRRGDLALGSLYLTNKQAGGLFTEADEVAVGALGAYAAVAIHHLRLISRQKDLTRSLLTAQEEERRSVAHDLHDGLTQHVMAAHAHLEAFKRARSLGNEERAIAQADQGMKYLHEAVVESRRMINNLRLLVLDDLGLSGALGQLLQEEITRGGWEPTSMKQNIGAERFDITLETAIYRVAQETLTNARRHGHTSRVQMSLMREIRGSETYLSLEVRDWGKGFVFREGFAAVGHYGLQGIVERVHLLDGTCEFQTAPGLGTRVFARFPVVVAPLQLAAAATTAAQ